MLIIPFNMSLTPWFSFCLNWLRFGAAFVVLWGHGQFLMGDEIASTIGGYGHTMVILFFVMSGYIIARTTKDGISDIRVYFIYRFTRVWVVALPVILACFIAYSIFYFSGSEFFLEFDEKFSLIHFFKSVFFLNHTWSSGDYLLLNLPFWSLCFEVWYYILFGLIYFRKNHWSVLFIGCIFLFMGPAIWVLMPIWFAGALLVYVKRIYLNNAILLFGSFVFFCIGLSFHGFELDVSVQYLISSRFPQTWILGPATKFMTDNIAGIFFFFSLWFLGSVDVCRINPQFVRLGRDLAGFSFTLYLLHDLIFKLASAFFKSYKLSFEEYMLVIIFDLVVCYFFSTITEAKTGKVRRYFLDKLNIQVEK